MILSCLTATALGGCSYPDHSSATGTPAPAAQAPTTVAVGKGFCEVLNSNEDVALTLFTEVIASQRSSFLIADQIAMLDEIEVPPPGLENELVIWRDYLVRADKAALEQLELMEAYDINAQEAGDALFDEYLNTCFDYTDLSEDSAE